MNKTIIFTLFFMLFACVHNPDVKPHIAKGDEHMINNQKLEAVQEYRTAYTKNPRDIEAKMKLQKAMLDSAQYFYSEGKKLRNEQKYDAAIVQFNKGLQAMPAYGQLLRARKETLQEKFAHETYTQAIAAEKALKFNKAIELFNKSVKIKHDFQPAIDKLDAYDRWREQRRNKLALSSNKTIGLNFFETGVKEALSFFTEEFGVNIVFDEAVRNQPVSISAQNTTFYQALELILNASNLAYKKIGRNTIIITPNTDEKRQQYDDYFIRTFHLKSASAKKVAKILQEHLNIEKITVNETLNTIVLRERKDVLKLADLLIKRNDVKPAEIVLEVEVMEVSRTKNEQLGVDYGSQISATFPTYSLGDSFEDTVLKQGTLTLPNLTLRYFKQDVDAETLANPKIRTLSRKNAKIHIGDRVPLRSSTIQDATGQVRTTYEYQEIGIRMNITPEIHSDDTVKVNMKLEVSSLGQNLGTTSEPAYSIGTRNVETVMLLQDEETAILGGLIKDEDRKTRVKVPGLGNIPAIGRLFEVSDDQVERKEILLTITPHIIRPLSDDPQNRNDIYSGGKERLATESAFEFMGKGAALPTIDMNKTREKK